MMNPDLMRLAQEQMSRMSPSDLARMQQQIMANPHLIRIASENMKNMRTEDFKRAAQQLNQTSPEEMLDMTSKIAGARPEDFAAMKAQADAQISYAISGAKMLKQQGNELHGRGRYADAAAKYKLAKDNLKNVPSAAGQTLQSQCAVNLMACYLKTGKFVECVSEGSEVLTYDSSNVKAYYRRGQAYRELGNLEAAVADLSKAQGICPEDKTIAEVLRDAEEKLAMEGGGANLPSKGVVIEEIVEEDASEPSSTDQRSSSNSGYSVSDPLEGAGNSAQSESSEDIRNDPATNNSPPSTVNLQEAMRKSMKDPAMRQMMASTMKNMSPDLLAMMSEQFGMKLSKKDAAKAQQAMSSLSQGDLDRMMNLVDRAQQGVEIAQKTKNWLIGRKGLVLPIAMLAVAFILHWLGF